MKLLLQLVFRDKLIFSWFGKRVAWYVLFLLRVVLWPVTTILAVMQERQACPDIKDKLLMVPAVEISRMIHSKEATCEEVVQAYINRAKEVNPILNAIVQDRFQEALEEARKMDVYLTSQRKLGRDAELKKTHPLLGVPLTVKETIGVKGMSNTAGFSLLESRKAADDAQCIKLLRAAGAIPILVSNTPELCMCWETYNPHTGRTNNPYDPRRTPGGSSGGEAALLSAGASVISVASDVCGSLRLPAMYTCVYGHKPTPGYVCNQGHFPTTDDFRWNTYFTLGPMCRYADDLPVMLKVLIGDEERARPLRLDEKVDLSKLRLFYLEDDGPSPIYTDPVNPEIKDAMRKAVSYLQKECGMTVHKMSVKNLEEIMHYTTFLITRMNGVATVFQKDEDHPDEWRSIFGVFLDRILGKSSATLHALLFGPIKAMVELVPEEDYKYIVKRSEEYKTQFKELLGEDGVFLYPAFPDAAHFHYQIYYKFLNTAYLSIFNLTEMPATACPLGLNSQGLPIGIQISAWQGQDRLTFAVAKALENHFGGWIPPCPTPP